MPTQYAAVSPTPRNNDQISQTGFVINGPVVIPKIYNGHDKTFFMVAFERYKSHTAINYSARVPTTAERAGDFSALCSVFNSAGLCTTGIQLYDPLSPLDANNNRTVYFPNNNIASRINTTGAALVNFLPAPNVANAAITATNYISTQTSYPSSNPALILRIDQTLGGKDKFNAIFFQNGLTQNYPLQGFTQGIGPGGYGYNVYRRNQGGSLDEVHQFSSSTVLDSRFGLVYHPSGWSIRAVRGTTCPGSASAERTRITRSRARPRAMATPHWRPAQADRSVRAPTARLKRCCQRRSVTIACASALKATCCATTCRTRRAASAPLALTAASRRKTLSRPTSVPTRTPAMRLPPSCLATRPAPPTTSTSRPPCNRFIWPRLCRMTGA